VGGCVPRDSRRRIKRFPGSRGGKEWPTSVHENSDLKFRGQPDGNLDARKSILPQVGLGVALSHFSVLSCSEPFHVMNDVLTISEISAIGIRYEGFALIPAGNFTMGRTSGDTDTDAPSVSVNVSAFYIQEKQTTKAQWDEVRVWGTNNGYTDLAVGGWKASNHPVNSVRWTDVVKWCNARSEKEGLTPVYTVDGVVMRAGTTDPEANWSANGYRLPTEAEWEKAARGGVEGKRFPWGTDTISHAQANYWGSSGYAYDQSTIKGHHPNYATIISPYTAPGEVVPVAGYTMMARTSPVGIFAANGYGLYDMSGNVREWCWDWYGESSYVNGATDPRGAASAGHRVFRGGSWADVADDCRAARRASGSNGISVSLGFRPARNLITNPHSMWANQTKNHTMLLPKQANNRLV
jgi:sulfatase modifying factor 1